MKKIIAIVVAIVMMAAMAVPAFADNVTVDGGTAGTTVTYNTSQGFEVSIPSAISINAETNVSESADITVVKAKLAPEATLNVAITSANADGTTWTLKAAGADDVTYTIAMTPSSPNTVASMATVAKDATILTVASSATYVESSAKASLVLTAAGTTQVANFTDTLTFTVTVD